VSNAIEEAHGELSLARVALAESDLQHAANHVAGAIAYCPTLPEAHELLAEIAAHAAAVDNAAADLFPIDDHPYVGTVVARAHLLGARDPLAALDLLASATRFDPTMPWADVPWVRHLDLEPLDADAILQLFLSVIRALNPPLAQDVKDANEIYLDLARRAAAAHPDHALVQGSAAGIARRFDETKEAVAWGRRAVELEHTKLTAVWYAYALRADGQLDEALAVMERACQANPLDLDLRADMSSWLAVENRLDEALAVIEEAMRVDPTYDCAVHTAHRLRFQRDGDPRHLVALVDFIRTQPIDSHPHFDLDQACDGQEWLGYVPAAREAITNILWQVGPDERTQTLHTALSALEVPSAIALVRRECPNISLSVPDPPPDMVVSIGPGPVLWRYDGAAATPAVPPPPPHASALMAETATPTWKHPLDAYERARPLGRLGVTSLLALLVHPPARPKEHADLADTFWERCVQTFSCLGILHCTVPGPTGAPGGGTRDLLARVMDGIEDWTTETAMFALVAESWVEPSCRAEVSRLVADRFHRAADAAQRRPVTILPSLARIALMAPELPDAASTLARDILADEREDEG
jgi:tetratricopeptide (TPR) repeat protein